MRAHACPDSGFSSYRYATCIFMSGKVLQAPFSFSFFFFFFAFCASHRTPRVCQDRRCGARRDGRRGDAPKDAEERAASSAGPSSVREGRALVFCYGFVCFWKIVKLFVNKEEETLSTENTCHLGVSGVA